MFRNFKIRHIVFCIFILVLFCSTVSASTYKNAKVKMWFDTEFVGNDTAGNRPYFDVHHLYLITEISLEEGFSGFAEFEFEHAVNTERDKGTVKIERLYSQKKLSSYISLRFGKFSTPFGYWTPTHWTILAETVSKPIHEENNYPFSECWN